MYKNMPFSDEKLQDFLGRGLSLLCRAHPLQYAQPENEKMPECTPQQISPVTK